jgi:flagellar basal-body rod protein FlgB
VSDLFSSVNFYHQSLDYHLERHNVVASNVAHVDTPGYRPVDLERVESFDAMLRVSMRKTDQAHMMAAGGEPIAGRVFEDIAAGAGNDLNYVSLDREAAKLAANQLRFDTVSAITRATLKQLSYAANDAKG